MIIICYAFSCMNKLLRFPKVFVDHKHLHEFSFVIFFQTGNWKQWWRPIVKWWKFNVNGMSFINNSIVKVVLNTFLTLIVNIWPISVIIITIRNHGARVWPPFQTADYRWQRWVGEACDVITLQPIFGAMELSKRCNVVMF